MWNTRVILLMYSIRQHLCKGTPRLLVGAILLFVCHVASAADELEAAIQDLGPETVAASALKGAIADARKLGH